MMTQEKNGWSIINKVIKRGGKMNRIQTENNENKYKVIKKVMESTRINEDDKVYAIEMFLKGWYTEKQIEWIWI